MRLIKNGSWYSLYDAEGDLIGNVYKDTDDNHWCWEPIHKEFMYTWRELGTISELLRELDENPNPTRI